MEKVPEGNAEDQHDLMDAAIVAATSVGFGYFMADGHRAMCLPFWRSLLLSCGEQAGLSGTAWC